MVALRQSILESDYVSLLLYQLCGSYTVIARTQTTTKEMLLHYFSWLTKHKSAQSEMSIIELKRLMAQIFRYQTSTYIFEFN